MVIPDFEEKIKAEEERKAELFSQQVVTWQPPESWAVVYSEENDEGRHLSRKSTLKRVDLSSADLANYTHSFADNINDDCINQVRSLIPPEKTASTPLFKFLS